MIVTSSTADRSPENLVFSDMSFMVIFMEVTENECIIARHLLNRDPLRDLLRGPVSPHPCCVHARYGWGSM